MEMWNEKCLSWPAISTYKTLDRDIDLKQLFSICKEFTEFLENDKFLQAEYLVLSRIVYRMKQKFRTSKDFKAVERVCKCLKIYFDVNLLPHIKTFAELIPNKYRKDTYLPSKSLLDFILVRLQGIAKLLEKIVNSCRETAYLLDVRIKTGQFWKIGFIVYSVISRLYSLAKYTTNKICEFYGKLITFSNKLQCTSHWLPKEYQLPNDLKQWLDISWLDEDIQIIENTTQLSDIIKLYDLVEDSDIEFCDEYILIKEEEEDCKEDDIQIITPAVFTTEEDVGEVLELDENDFISLNNSLKPFKNRNRYKSRKMKNKKVVEISDQSSSVHSSINILKNKMKDKSFLKKNKNKITKKLKKHKEFKTKQSKISS